MRLENKVAFISGAARGMGAAEARLFAQEGAKVVIGDEGRQAIARMHGYAKGVGRDPAAIGIEGRITVAGQGPEQWMAEAKGWEEMGATHLAVNTGFSGLTSPDQHIEAIRRVKEVMGD